MSDQEIEGGALCSPSLRIYGKETPSRRGAGLSPDSDRTLGQKRTERTDSWELGIRLFATRTL
jgi:hypothetical protein